MNLFASCSNVHESSTRRSTRLIVVVKEFLSTWIRLRQYYFLSLPVHRNVFLSGKLSDKTNHFQCYIPLWWRYTSVVKEAINYNNSVCLKSFTAISFGSCIRSRCMVDKLLQKSCHVEHLTSLYAVYVCSLNLNHNILKIYDKSKPLNSII